MSNKEKRKRKIEIIKKTGNEKRNKKHTLCREKMDVKEPIMIVKFFFSQSSKKEKKK